jgi:4-amino-4-deoxy-L-arabinose transferase-like glycosyltransferase
VTPGLRSPWLAKPINRPLFLLVAIAIIWLGFAIRLVNLAGDSFWIDELATVRVAQTAASALGAERDHPPLIYLLTAASLSLFGDGEFAGRLPALFAGILAFPLLMAVARLLGKPEAGLWAALLLAMSPYHLRYSQEARHYALLMTVSLASFLFLWQAMARPRWQWWLAYGLATVLNLYTHYGALIVLAAQALLIAGWLICRVATRRYLLVKYPLVTGVVAGLAYTPWASRLWAALQFNIGGDNTTETGTVTPFVNWLQTLFQTFGAASSQMATVLLGLAMVGVAIWLYRKEWRAIMLSIGALLLPLLLIVLFQVARGPQPRYAIYIYPFFLLPIGVTLAAISAVGQRAGYIAGRWPGHLSALLLRAVIAGTFIAALWPAIKAEHLYVMQDWRGVVSFLDVHGQDGDVIVAYTLNYPQAFNTTHTALPYYLERSERDYWLLRANALTPVAIQVLERKEATVWGVILVWGRPVEFPGWAAEVTYLPTNIYIVKELAQSGSVLPRLIEYYQQIMAVAYEPSPRCAMEKDLAILYIVTGDRQAAAEALAQSDARCPTLPERALPWTREWAREWLAAGPANEE